MEQILLTHFGLHVTSIKTLEGYISQNYLINSSEGNFVLKIYPHDERSLEDLAGENSFVEHLGFSDSKISTTIPSLNGEKLVIEHLDGQSVILKLLSFIDGEFLANANHTPSMLRDFGKHLALIDNKLLSFRNSAIESRRLEWNLSNFELITPLTKHIQDQNNRKIVDHFILKWRANVAPKLPHLRHSIIHNDANDWNVLIQNDGFGLIDLGDASYTALINELAIACTYPIMDKED